MTKTSIKIVAIVALAIVLMNFSAVLTKHTNTPDELDEKHREILVRSVGHNLLLHAGDSTSRVLPANSVGDNIYELEFENQFAFKPDTLVNIVRKNLATEDSLSNFLVNVFDCQTNEMVYGFEIRPKYSDIEPCLGRSQPRACYRIQITFFNKSEEPSFSTLHYVSLFTLFGLGCIALIASPMLKRKSRKTEIGVVNKIGKYQFAEEQGLLIYDNEKISLSIKEVKVLKILMSNIYQLVSRENLLHEVWEKEGVITSRSLDVFISRLRKKLSHDPSVKITNVHGRGYKLEII